MVESARRQGRPKWKWSPITSTKNLEEQFRFTGPVESQQISQGLDLLQELILSGQVYGWKHTQYFETCSHYFDYIGNWATWLLNVFWTCSQRFYQLFQHLEPSSMPPCLTGLLSPWLFQMGKPSNWRSELWHLNSWKGAKKNHPNGQGIEQRPSEDQLKCCLI